LLGPVAENVVGGARAEYGGGRETSACSSKPSEDCNTPTSPPTGRLASSSLLAMVRRADKDAERQRLTSSGTRRCLRSRTPLRAARPCGSRKNLRLLIEAFRGLQHPDLATNRPACQLVFVGDGLEDDELAWTRSRECRRGSKGRVWWRERKRREVVGGAYRLCVQGVDVDLFRPEARDYTLRQSWGAEPQHLDGRF
jgi:hypothetical protein